MRLLEHPEGRYLAPIMIIHPCDGKTMIVPPCYDSMQSKPMHALGEGDIPGDQNLKPSHSEAHCPPRHTKLGNPSQLTLPVDGGDSYLLKVLNTTP
jgi:hypothetical protein